jgi:hypothetical protein
MNAFQKLNATVLFAFVLTHHNTIVFKLVAME